MKAQRGATLIVALVMLVVLTLGAVMSYNLNKSSLLIIGNQQASQATTSAARQVIERVISRDVFSSTPQASLGTSNSADVDLKSGSLTVADPSSPISTNAVRTELTPQPCIRKALEVAIVDISDPATQACISGVGQNFGVVGANTGSNCVDVVWEITAVASDPVTNANVTVVQGVTLRQDRSLAMKPANFCS
jgi:Tfp pilus assembly protein PilX